MALHIGIDAQTLPVRAICVTSNNVSDAAVMPELLAQVSAQEPLLTAIATARGLPVAELASRVLGKMNAYAAASGALIGRRQAAEDLIDVAATPEDVAGIAW